MIDLAYDAVRFAGRGKIDEDSVNFFIKIVLQSICDKTDLTLLISWHPSQAGSSRDNADGWSVAWHNAPRARLALSEVKDTPDTYELRVVKRNHGPKGQPLNWKFHNGALLPLDAVPDDGKAMAFRQVCVKAAIEAANLDVPFNRRDAVPDLVFREAGTTIGRRPTKQEVRNALEEAVRASELRYVHHTRHRAAGFYPPDAELAQDLARSAKLGQRGGPAMSSYATQYAESWGKVRYPPAKGTVLGVLLGAGSWPKRCGFGCRRGAGMVCVDTPRPPLPSARLWLALAYLFFEPG